MGAGVGGVLLALGGAVAGVQFLGVCASLTHDAPDALLGKAYHGSGQDVHRFRLELASRGDLEGDGGELLGAGFCAQARGTFLDSRGARDGGLIVPTLWFAPGRLLAPRRLPAGGTATSAPRAPRREHEAEQHADDGPPGPGASDPHACHGREPTGCAAGRATDRRIASTV